MKARIGNRDGGDIRETLIISPLPPHIQTMGLAYK